MPNNPKGFEIEPAHIEKLKKIVADNPKGWSVVVARVDPDGIGSAVAMKAILEHLGAEEARIYYGGSFSHPMNKVMYNLFELENQMSELSALPPEGPIALVDSSKLEDSRFETPIEKERFKVVVDHHRDPQAPGNGRFIYIVSCGAASTLAYLLAKKVEAPLSEAACTLIAIGILSDTDRLTTEHVTAADRRAYFEAMEHGEQDKIAKSYQYVLPARFYDILADALRDRELIEAHLVAHPPGLLQSDEGDWLSLFADLLRRHEGAVTTTVWGLTDDDTLRASVRGGDGHDGDLNGFICKLFGKSKGGAKHGSGGAVVKLQLPEFLKPVIETAGGLIGYIDSQIKRKLKPVDVKKDGS